MNDIGSIKTALQRAILASTFADRLAAIEAEFGDGITLTPPTTVLTHELMSEGVPSFPMVEIVSREALSNAESDVPDLDHRIEVAWTVIGDDEAILTKQVERYALATMRLVFLTIFVGIGNCPARLGNLTWIPTAPTNRARLPVPFIKGAIIEVWVRTLG